MKKIKKATLLMAIVIFTVACGNNAGDYMNEELSQQSTEKTDTVTIIDSSGTEVCVPTECEKVICVWPSGTQLFVTLGLGDLLVGVSEDSKEQSWAVEMYPRLKEITSCSNDESAESLLNLNADVVLTTEADVASDWRSKGITAVTFSYYSVDEMKESIATLAKFLPDEYANKCTKYLEYLDSNINDVMNALDGNVTKRECLYYIHGNNNKGLYKTAGGGTMNEAWAKDAYTEFATSDLLAASETVVDAEAILEKNPSVIVIGGRYQKRLREELLNTEEWANIDAVLNDRIYTIPYGISPFDRFGAEFALMIPWVATTVYPEYYVYDTSSEIKRFYKEFTGYALSDEQVSFIVNGLAPNGEEDIHYESK